MTMRMNEIDFLIIGAAKSATTWLQYSLQRDPEVYMPDPELHYFSREFERGDDWYLSQFSPGPGVRLIGEKSNSYLDMPEAAGRIHAALPDIRLVAQLRNPIERAYSDYCMLFRRGTVDRNIEQFLSPRKAQGNRFLVGGLYGEQIARFLDHFPAERLKVVLFEDTLSRPEAMLNEVRGFLGLGPFIAPPLAEKVKDKEAPVLDPSLRRLLKPFKSAVAPLRGTRLFQTLRGMLARPTRYEPLTPSLRAELLDYYADDTARLGRMIGRDLSNWLHDPAGEDDHANRLGAA
ncbi:sulfotransferase family protein [Prosthecomicrobium sp. N25]|uniref:sulfotransferase family protein n=1 Tax=Prosthecomicrobium sp. N25 TaxID=3129254 RepID=UPI00307804C1